MSASNNSLLTHISPASYKLQQFNVQIVTGLRNYSETQFDLKAKVTEYGLNCAVKNLLRPLRRKGEMHIFLIIHVFLDRCPCQYLLR